jgi:hypothetical protein
MFDVWFLVFGAWFVGWCLGGFRVVLGVWYVVCLMFGVWCLACKVVFG